MIQIPDSKFPGPVVFEHNVRPPMEDMISGHSFSTPAYSIPTIYSRNPYILSFPTPQIVLLYNENNYREDSTHEF
jgi:hypothetical protein